MKIIAENPKIKVFFLPVNTGFVINGLPDQRCIEFYSERSGNGIDCSIVGNVVISDGYGANNVCSTISNDKVWETLSTAISSNGTKPGIQLSSTWDGYSGNKKFVASRNENPIKDYKKSVSNIKLPAIENILFNLRNSIELSINAGFKHIQVHAAHGYLFSLLIDPSFSVYSNFFLNELKKIATDLKFKGIESSIRFSLLTGSQKLDEDRESLINQIMETGFDFFDVSFGFYNINKNLIYPETSSALKSRRLKTIELANKYSDKKIIISGKMNKTQCYNLPSNIHLGICRDLIANPKALSEPKNGCRNCGDCHYYSKGKQSLKCGVFNS